MNGPILKVTDLIEPAARLLRDLSEMVEAVKPSILAEIRKKAIEDGPSEEHDYCPIFYFLMDDKEFWSIEGWMDDAVKVGPENGAEAVAFVMSRPKYNTITRLDDLAGWCICCRRGISEKAMPRIVKANDASPMSKKRTKKESPPVEDDNPLMG